MAQMRMPRKISQKNVLPAVKFDVTDLKNALNPLLSQIVNQVNVLNETVSSLVNSLNSRNCLYLDKKNICDFGNTNISSDYSTIPTENIGKSYDLMKEQLLANQQSINTMSEKLTNMEKLLTSLVKRQTRKFPMADTKWTEVLQHFEEFLLQYSSRNKTLSQSTPLTEDCNKVKLTLDPISMQLLTLNEEKDFPNGSWLGDPTNPKLRVRCPIEEKVLLSINANCPTAEKMALTLLDRLFSKETLAISNLSGKSRLGKKQLDPLMIYGVKCHLMHSFNTTEKQWERIKQNIDSKCRSAWKKRRLTSPYCISYHTDEDGPDIVLEDSHQRSAGESFTGRPKSRLIRTIQGDIEVVHATADQVLLFQDLHNVHVLEGDHVLPIISSDGEDIENGISLSKCSEHGDLAIISEATDLHSTDNVSFVMEPMLEVLTEQGPLVPDHGS